MIKKGEFILLYGDRKAKYLIKYEPLKHVDTHLGRVKLPEKAEFGEGIRSTSGNMFYILHPSLNDLSMRVKRTTTIIYPKEAGMIILELGVKSGSKVIEVGSGSGAFTVLLSNIVGDKGKVYSFERREEFLENAKKNVERYGLGENVKFVLRDVEEDGFGVKNADAVFIDVPEPWKLINKAYESLKLGHRLGCLSPNIEQVQKTIEAMKEAGFINIKCLEMFERQIRIKKNMTRPVDRMIAHTGYIYFGNKIKK